MYPEWYSFKYMKLPYTEYQTISPPRSVLSPQTTNNSLESHTEPDQLKWRFQGLNLEPSACQEGASSQNEPLYFRMAWLVDALLVMDCQCSQSLVYSNTRSLSTQGLRFCPR